MLPVYWLEQSEMDVRKSNDWLSDGERAHLLTLRFEKRRREWLLGRWTAKSIITSRLNLSSSPAGFAEIEIRSSSLGAPEAFLANQRMALEISLSHRAGRAVCALANSDTALGCDLEIVEPRGAAFVEDYLVPREQQIIARAGAENRDWLITLLWSAKESALKSLHTGLRLDTYSVIVKPDLPVFETEGASTSDSSPKSRDACWRRLEVCSSNGANFSGWWQYDGIFVRTITAIPQPAVPILQRVAAAHPQEFHHPTLDRISTTPSGLCS